MEQKKLFRDHLNHHHYWIEEGELYESYNTIRGLRYRHLESVLGMADNNRLTKEDVEHVEQTYLNSGNDQ